MKLERMLAIVILLLNRKIIQAKELAERFEVSVRTIYRDIEAINQAGIPIVTFQGTNGGIGLAEGYRLDRNVLTDDELAAIVTSLRSMATPFNSGSNELLVEKINSIVPPARTEEFQLKTSQILIDLSPWDRAGHLERKLRLLKEAIEQTILVTFSYSNANGEITARSVEPYTLVLKGRQWYLQAFCIMRGEFRLFKLIRMKELQLLDETFVRRTLPPQEQAPERGWYSPDHAVPIVLRFHPNKRHLAGEWFDMEEQHLQEDGSVIVNVLYPEDQWLYGFILSFGPDVEVLEPPHLRHIILDRAKRIASLYQPPLD